MHGGQAWEFLRLLIHSHRRHTNKKKKTGFIAGRDLCRCTLWRKRVSDSPQGC